MTVYVFGIRHHGPGSARSLRQALESLQPDAILIEGPPDADSLIPMVIDKDMQPPAALLIYAPDAPDQAVYYPFALFSPEWQALLFGVKEGIPTRFMDLPQMYQFPLRAKSAAEMPADVLSVPTAAEEQPPVVEGQATLSPELNIEQMIRQDPLRWLSTLAGYSDSERWWEHVVEQRAEGMDVFEAILQAMTALREAAGEDTDPREILREAYMRKTIREAQQGGAQRIAVICGAWHSSALVNTLVNDSHAKSDVALLKGLTKAKVEATWVPWTHGRLARHSGYGAGIESPGWYHHLWSHRDDVAIRWVSHVAELLRREDLDASTAQVIDAVRLAESLAALRDRPIPGLPELSEAIQATLCFGNNAPMKLIHDKLIVGDRLGEVPPSTPMVPLQQDMEREVKRLRLKRTADKDKLDLDLRKNIDKDRSLLLYRLNLIKVPWGQPQRISMRVQSTFHENWVLQWHPEFAVTLIEASTWGTTVPMAADAYARHMAEHAQDLPTLTTMLNSVLMADLPSAAQILVEQIKQRAALSANIEHLMAALPPLARIQRYGNVRGTDTHMVASIVDSLIMRISIGLPNACASLNDDAARDMLKLLDSTNTAIVLLQQAEHYQAWHGALVAVADQSNVHGLIAGRAARLLLDAGALDVQEVARRLGLAISTASSPMTVAAWVEGFLQGSGTLLLHDDKLWNILDAWVTEQSADMFTNLLPLLRRTFSSFSDAERRQLGQKVRRQGLPSMVTEQVVLNVVPADQVLSIVAALLGLTFSEPLVR